MKDWNTSLLLAAEKGHEEIVKVLLEKGANFDVVNRVNISHSLTHSARSILLNINLNVTLFDSIFLLLSLSDIVMSVFLCVSVFWVACC